MKYSIIIPAWNEAEYLPDTLQAVTQVMLNVRNAGRHDGELIVVDNNSSDHTATVARESGAKVVFEAVNQIARARNCGAAEAIGDALIFLDADTIFTDKLLTHTLNQLDEGLVVGGGSIITPDQDIPPMAMKCLTLWNWISRTGRLAAGCFLYCRRDAFLDIGGFNERVYAGEEIFLSRQLKRWARKRKLKFDIVTIDPVITSVRKLLWYTPGQLAKQLLLVFIPGAVFSKRLCRTWYDTTIRRN